ncbi:MAG: HAD family hydrolase [Chloroflexi bacterium]|nr:HAD family hydrolase [Chloroflexota bacterium]
MISTILFDGFGTLLAGGFSQDPEAMAAICHTFGLEAPPDLLLEQCYRSVIEVGAALGPFQASSGPLPPFHPLRWWYARFFEHAFAALDLDADCDVAADLTLSIYATAPLYPEVRQVLDLLSEGYRLGLLSNADDDFLDAATAGLYLPFAAVMTSEAAGVYKPHPAAFRAALDRLGGRADETLYVGDNQVDDVLGARAAGMQVAWVNRNGQTLRADVPTPDFELTDLRGLPRLLRGA